MLSYEAFTVNAAVVRHALRGAAIDATTDNGGLMQFELTEQQRLFEASLADWFNSQSSSRASTSSLAAADREDRWRAIAELGWLGLIFDEADGGLGCETMDLGLLLHAFGHHLEVLPYASAVVIAGGLLAALGSEAQRQAWLPSLIQGEMRLALAHAEPGLDWPWNPRRVQAQRIGDGWILNGTKQCVEDTHEPTHWLVSARCDQGLDRIFLMGCDARVPRVRYRHLQGGWASDLHFDAHRIASECLLGDPHAAHRNALQRAVAHGLLAQCWGAAGVLTMLVQQTAHYVKQRRQFGRSLAEFQAVRHQLADMRMEQVEARASCELAALQWACAKDILVLASATQARVARACERVGNRAIQLHGAMGVCDELPIAPAFRWLAAFQAQSGRTGAHEAFLGAWQLQSASFSASAILEAQA